MNVVDMKYPRLASRILFCLWLLAAAATAAHAQNDQRAAVYQRIQQLSAAYRNTDRLSFDLTYKYAGEDRPTVYLDSLGGSFKLNGSKFWYVLDSTEFMGNDTINLAIFKEDKVIYLNSPVAAQSANPLALIDSVLLNNQYQSCTLMDTGHLQKISIEYKPGYMFKKVEYLLNSTTGWIERMTAVIRSEEMYDPALKPLFAKQASYGILTAYFRNYRQKAFDASFFNCQRYLKKNGRAYNCAENFKGYQLINSQGKL